MTFLGFIYIKGINTGLNDSSANPDLSSNNFFLEDNSKGFQVTIDKNGKSTIIADNIKSRKVGVNINSLSGSLRAIPGDLWLTQVGMIKITKKKE